MYNKSMKTQTAAIKRGKAIMGDHQFFVYQFPAGHWGWAAINSPVGNSLDATEDIYPGVPARVITVVTPTETGHILATHKRLAVAS